jgi:adenosylcobinamide amidohydrolase
LSGLVLADPVRTIYDSGLEKSVVVWRLPPGTTAVASTITGGGLGTRAWVFNAEVAADYAHADPAAHAEGIALTLGLDPAAGASMLTAAPLSHMTFADEDGTECAATVGITHPTWAAAEEGAMSAWTPGTINLVCWLPRAMTDAALVNAVVTVTEAKAQALAEAGVPGTGTASDAIVVCCPPGQIEVYGGPRSPWGAPLARAVHRAVAAGIASYVERKR